MLNDSIFPMKISTVQISHDKGMLGFKIDKNSPSPLPCVVFADEAFELPSNGKKQFDFYFCDPLFCSDGVEYLVEACLVSPGTGDTLTKRLNARLPVSTMVSMQIISSAKFSHLFAR